MKLSTKKGKLNNSGFSLVEVLVAIVILAIISLPVLSTFTNAARINAKARRTENANTAINNIIEEAKDTQLDELIAGNGKYNYQMVGSAADNKYEVSDARGKSYFTGVDGEKYYVTAQFDPSAYTTQKDASGATIGNPNNDINSTPLSIYADVSSNNNFVYRDDDGDEEALEYFKAFKAGVTRDEIKKTTNVNIAITVADPSSTAVNLKLKQDITVTVTYKYITSAYAYPDFVKTTTMSEYVFNADKTEVSPGVYKYTVSGKLKDNAKNMYIFYTPFDGERTVVKDDDTVKDELKYAKDELNINYSYPSSIAGKDVEFKDINVYMLQQEKIIREGTSHNCNRIGLKIDNIKINGNTVATENGTKAFTVYSNINGWPTYTKPNNQKNVLYRMTVDVWLWKDVEEDVKKGDPPTATKIATVTTTKED